MAFKQQSKLQQYFQSFRNSDANTIVGINNAQTGAAADKNREGLKRNAEDECKENMPPGSITNLPGKKTTSGTSKSLGRNSKQLFLDLGQKDFSASKCSICGMVYAKGHEQDEKLHRSIHQSAVQGLRFQGWGQERVVLSDPFTGRLLMVMPSDPPAHVKRAQEVCSFVEKAHGITAGWLMSAKQCRVFLFVSLQKRIVGLAVLEPIKQAYRAAVAAAGPQDEEADSSRPAQQQQQLTQSQPQTFQQMLQQQRQQQPRPPLMWPGLHRSSSSRRPGGAGANSLLLSAGAGTGATAVDSAIVESDVVKADSCPPSLLAAAAQVQVNSSMTAAELAQQQTGSQGPSKQQQQQHASGTSSGSVCRGESKAAVCAEQSGLQKAAEPDQALISTGQQSNRSQQQQQQQQQCEMPPPPAQPAALSASARSGGGSRSFAGSSGKGASSSGRAAAGAAVSGGGGTSGLGGSSSRMRSFNVGGVSGGSGDGRCVMADRSKAMRAMLGVRMVWVSAEQRHKGMATKLLDAARCNMIPGYVVPRNQMAFMQPTEEGSKLAVSFTGTQQFLLYGLE